MADGEARSGAGAGEWGAMQASGLPASPMLALLGVALVRARPGEVVLSATPRADFANQHGIAHGGYAATLLDTACGGAVISQLAPGQICLTLELKTVYLSAIRLDAGPLAITGRVQKLGRSVAFAEAEIRDGAGQLLASATSTLTVRQAG